MFFATIYKWRLMLEFPYQSELRKYPKNKSYKSHKNRPVRFELKKKSNFLGDVFIKLDYILVRGDT